MKTLIEIHILQNFAPSNLNRDDTGAPKDALFGGIRRARISSQCLKRSTRQYFKEMIENNKLTENEVATRTKRIIDEVVKELVIRRKPEDEALEKARQALKGIKLTIKDDGKSEYLLFVGKKEITGLAQAIFDGWDNIKSKSESETSEKKSKGKKDAAKDVDPGLKKALEAALNGGKALDIALFGRMLADMPEKSQNAACQVAHAISTHAVDREFDFYTAVDDLKPEDSSGADMMGTVEFTSACFYRYAVIDWMSLQSNLQGDSELARKGLQAFLRGFVVSEPTGKQNSFAAHNPPEFVAITVNRDAAPRNLANAFESPVRYEKDKALTYLSAERLVQKAKLINSAYPTKARTWVLNLTGVNTDGFGETVTELDSLIGQAIKEIGTE
ncbi:MAG TPA: type I-E CRISPR-associated protein Cas7/Cse4/CasC [Candidatus Rifleibacterium sp.]|nr:type I-E CRISPR-associated protein Cas7/Cse4/CasC [Candidatus Rifleibacterium sp.]HPT47211.1 type I-E CRISPR-associated protein Cas7/Cse4/CasC [Candidatus Rifleibacterium sp.]